MGKTLTKNLFGSIRELTESKGNKAKTQKEEDTREQSPAFGTGLSRLLFPCSPSCPQPALSDFPCLMSHVLICELCLLLHWETSAPQGRAQGLAIHRGHAPSVTHRAASCKYSTNKYLLSLCDGKTSAPFCKKHSLNISVY